MQHELVPLAERDHGADDENAPRALVVMRTGPDFAPGAAGDEILKLLVEGALRCIGLVDPGSAQHLAALGHAEGVAFFFVQGLTYNLLRMILSENR